MRHNWLDGWVQYYSREGPVVLLESQSTNYPTGKICYLAALPEATIKAWDNKIEVQQNGCITIIKGNPWTVLSKIHKKWNDWLFGYLGYDLKNHVEILYSRNTDAINAPDLFFMKPGVLLKMDMKTESVEVLKGAQHGKILYNNPYSEIVVDGLHSTVTKEQYCATVEAAKRQIYEGLYYEINLSHQLQAKFSGSPFQLYRKMRASGPVPFGAYIQFDDLAISCFSPERFLSKKGKTVFSQPIKGTMKRHSNKEKDQRLIERLNASSKNRAENLMIVDLVRNDLSKIARPASVRVSKLFEIQTFSTVHQMVSTICAETQTDNPMDIIKVCYPMGSMTGAPKIRVMQAIEQFENYRRGIYSGAIGYLSPDGNFDFNVVIRTAIINQATLYYAVGGAITSDSNPDEEWRETWLKAGALCRAINDQGYL